ncbi:MAG: GAF domain-containing protein [Candidatus Sumerlaeota bacterium]|nr:GAF domain-containing protein [Candidatus Sumerlaeota bacterium]
MPTNAGVSLAPLTGAGAQSPALSPEASALRAAEEALVQSWSLFEAIFISISDAVIFSDTQRRILLINPAATAIFGYTPEELKGQTAECLYASKADYEETGRQRFNVNALVQSQVFEMRYRRKDGTVFHGESLATAIRDSQGAIVGYVGIHRYITERKQAEEIIRLNQRRSETLARLGTLEESSINKLCDFALEAGIHLTGSAVGYLFFYNEEQKILTLYAWSKEVMKECAIEAPPAAFELDKIGLLGEAVRQRKPIIINDYEAPNPFKKGYPEGHISIRRHLSLPIFQGDRIVAVIGVGNKSSDYDDQDAQQLQLLMEGVWRLIERKQAEEERRTLETRMRQAQKLESLGVLAGGIAHDFNNLLMVVLGNADLALTYLPAESPARFSIQEIETASRRAADICKQMLSYSGKGQFVLEPLNLSRLVREMVHMLEISISKKAALRCQFADNLPAVEADATQIQQVVMNLIINASEAIGDKEGVITVSTGTMECSREYLHEDFLGETPKAGPYVFIEVADTGCGMDAQTQSKIFDPFFTTKFTGRGLGLAAVLGIIRGHKGAIKIGSEPGRGAAFKALFPASSKAALSTEAPGSPKPWSGNGVILVVDDEEGVRKLTKRMIERSGFTVLTASDGREAMEIFSQRSAEIACVLLDLTMPRMDGEETLAALRRIRDDVRVILSSGYNEQEIAQRFAGKGLSGFIQKPYLMASLNAKLQEALK